MNHELMAEVKKLQDQVTQLRLENVQLRQQQTTLEEAKNYYLKIFEDFPALIWRSGTDKLCNYFNKTWLEFTGRSMEQEYGDGWAEGVHPDDRPACMEIYLGCFDRHESFTMYYRMKNAKGEYRWIRDIGRPFYSLSGVFEGYIGSCYDVTEERNQTEELHKLNAMKDRLFSLVAHDLKAPFNAILGCIELLHEDAPDSKDQLKEIIDTLNRNATHTYQLLENLLTWARAQIGQVKVVPRPLELAHFVDSIIELARVNAAEKKVSIRNMIPATTMLLADRDILSMILRNLLSNAIKYSYPSSTITVQATTDANTLQLSVTDTGVGMDEGTLGQLFTLDHTISRPGTINERGTGLGLILCKEFATLHTIELTVKSQVGQGSTFTLTFPQSHTERHFS